MRIRAYRFICILFSILTLVSGICLDFLKTDSCFRCMFQEAQGSDSFSDVYPLEETRLSVPCQLTGTGDRTIHTIAECFTDSPALQHALLFSCRKNQYFSLTKAGLPYRLYCNEQITAYIHKTDGKKQIA